MGAIKDILEHFSPENKLRREYAKEALNQLKKLQDKPDRETRFGYRQHTSSPSLVMNVADIETEDDKIDRFDRDALTGAMRNLYRENPLFSGMVKRIVDNVCGAEGPRLQFMSGNDDYDTEVEKLWKTDSDNLEIRGMMTFGQFIRTSFSEVILTGDHGVIWTDEGKVQGIEEDRIRTPQKFAADKKVINGIRVDDKGRPIEYYVVSRNNPNDFKPYAADKFLLNFNPERFDQMRGVTEFYQAIEHLDDLDFYLQAEKFAAWAAAAFAFKMKRSNPPPSGQGPLGEYLPNTNTAGSVTGEASDFKKYQMGKAMLVNLRETEDFEILRSERPGTQFTPYVETMSRLIGVNSSLPLELILLNFKDANFSTIRAVLLEARRAFLARRVIPRKEASWCFDKWYNLKKANGELVEPAGIIPYYEWEFEGWHMVNPKEEIEAAKDAIDAGFSTQKIECAVLGRSDSDNRVQRQKELKDSKEREIPVVVGKPGALVLNGPENKPSVSIPGINQ